ncbi:MAG: DsbA family protein [Candidatus Dormiibacterota bacterium]
MTNIEQVHLHVDPVCPWAWVTSRWATRLEQLGELEIEWRLFSLGVANLPEGQEPGDLPVGRSGTALELLALGRRTGGNAAVQRLYTAMGEAAHIRHEDLTEAAVLERAWSAAGLDEAARHAGASDSSLWQDVLADHQAAVSACQAFGVPTLILDEGHGPGIFGPILTEVPSDDASRELLQEVLGIMRKGYFFELKRSREGHPPQTAA